MINRLISDSTEPIPDGDEIYDVGVLIFTRDLRVHDNWTLYVAGKLCKKIYPVFIFREEQINPGKNKYHSQFCVNFMIESLHDLLPETKNKLTFLHNEIPNNLKFGAIFISKDYTNYAINVRENHLHAVAKKHHANLIIVHNHALEIPLSTLPGKKSAENYNEETDDGVVYDSGYNGWNGHEKFDAYRKFTPYYRAANGRFKPNIIPSHKFVKKFAKISGASYSPNKHYDKEFLAEITGGRSHALKILGSIGKFSHYKHDRDYPGLDATTRLSAYNKFGCVSIREVYSAIAHKFSKSHDLIKQLWWRDFYYNIAVAYPRTTQGHSLQEKYDKVAWKYPTSSEKTKKIWNAWKTGKTGFDLVDAGMRQLVQTGYMHNRVRMVVANWLIYDAHIDWRYGEKFFAQHLVDYDPIQNNGGWTWCSGGGADSQDYHRIMNPDTQLEKFDKKRTYVKEYLGDENHEKIVDHATEREIALKTYARALY